MSGQGGIGVLLALQLSFTMWSMCLWLFAAGLVTSLTGGEADSVLGCVNWTGKAPTPDTLGRCAALDEKAAVLFLERDQALLSATAALLVCPCILGDHTPFKLMQESLRDCTLRLSKRGAALLVCHMPSWSMHVAAYAFLRIQLLPL